MLQLLPEIFELTFTWVFSAPVWTRCEGCEKFWCTLHEKHVVSCPCPSAEKWLFSPHSH